MKKLLVIICICLGFYSCKTVNNTSASDVSETNATAQDTVRIANDEVEYEIIIIEPGFNNWLAGRARPRGYYSQQFLEGRNQLYVAEWNRRVLNPSRYGDLYISRIEYDPTIDYGYEVNYLLYYYFIYFQRNYNQQLTGFIPRI